MLELWDWSLVGYMALGLFGVKFQFKVPNPIKAVQRVVTIRPQSFTPANIIRGGASVATFTNPITAGANLLTPGLAVGASRTGAGSALTIPESTTALATAGVLSQTNLSVKNIPVYSGISQRNTGLTQAYYTGALSFGQTTVGDANTRETWPNRIARLFGGASSAYVTGSVAASQLGKTGLLAKTVSYSSQGFASTQFGQAILSLFGQRIGGTLLSLLNFDLAGAVQQLTRETPSYVTVSGPGFGSSGGGAGGGGGFLPSQNTGQVGWSSAILPIIAILGIGGLLWFLLRKR